MYMVPQREVDVAKDAYRAALKFTEDSSGTVFVVYVYYVLGTEIGP